MFLFLKNKKSYLGLVLNLYTNKIKIGSIINENNF